MKVWCEKNCASAMHCAVYGCKYDKSSPSLIVGRVEQLDSPPAARRASISAMSKPVSREVLERAINGALRAAINDHGPITADRLNSAAKRVIGALANAGIDVPPPAAPPEKPADER